MQAIFYAEYKAAHNAQQKSYEIFVFPCKTKRLRHIALPCAGQFDSISVAIGQALLRGRSDFTLKMLHSLLSDGEKGKLIWL